MFPMTRMCSIFLVAVLGSDILMAFEVSAVTGGTRYLQLISWYHVPAGQNAPPGDHGVAPSAV